MAGVPELYLREFFLARRRLVEGLLENPHGVEEQYKLAGPLLAPMVATHGPAGVNVAPFMLSFQVRDDLLGEAVEELRGIREEYWGRGFEAVARAARFLLDWIYNLERVDPLVLVSHLMSRGHTYRNVEATGEAAVGILIPPDRGALELRCKASIVEDGLLYEYVNLLHDLMHTIPRGEASHPWYPVLKLEVKEIYDNSYQKLGEKIYP